ncbi:peptidase MA family metallohydrolase [Calderihabitans maritimus]|uniref:Peptidase MA-like domain-containing protein n=1 Tax=Calderihabitans maritimus TaxID=1246530 RepID=A0A1Z5HWN8_9FIRM|nr:hypothetical protein [Calderihabitans maritimus]GAW93751.1 hypothetical protein TherJR_0160 [Calderihabitans maritimus]
MPFLEFYGLRLETLGKILAAVLIGCFFISVAIYQKYPGWTRMAVYGVIRELARKHVEFKTRSWPELQSRHFLVRYQPQDAWVARLVLETAEESYLPLVRKLGLEPPGKVPIIIYPDRVSLNQSFGWDADQSAMGVYWAGVIRILSPNAWIETVDRDSLADTFKSTGPMAHEMAHLLVDYRTQGNYPRWLTEGIAQYLEREITGFQFEEYRINPDTQFYSLRQMDAQFDRLPDQPLAYWQSLAIIDYLVGRYGWDIVGSILDGLRQGKNLNTVFQDQLGMSLAEVEKNFITWARNR